MQFAARHIQTAEKIISQYNGEVPLHHYLKSFFAADKKYGSKDRKAISEACYCYYRIGKLAINKPVEERIKIGIFLCNDIPGIWQNIYTTEWIENWSSSLEQRIQYLKINVAELFPLSEKVSNGIDKKSFVLSHLIQPDLHLRIRPGKKDKVLQQLTAAAISFIQCNDNCIALSNATKLEGVLRLNEDVVIQDASSQRVAELLSLIPPHAGAINVWDCCAASGGKSILAYDVLKNVNLTVSDIRQSIIQNLKKRFAEALIKNYTAFVCDLTACNVATPVGYDLVICDAPCSGSGTWGRTPEQLSFFNEEKLNYYTSLQLKITANVTAHAKRYFLYITCSVFKNENEDIVNHILSNTSLQLIEMKYLKGYDNKADTMFAALFTALKP